MRSLRHTFTLKRQLKSSEIHNAIGTRLVKKKRFFGRNHVFIFTTGKSITPPQKPGFPIHMPIHTRCVQNTRVSLSHFGFLPLEHGDLFDEWHPVIQSIQDGWGQTHTNWYQFYQPLGLHALYGDVLFIATCMHFACNINLEKKRNLRLLAATPWDSMADFSWSQCPSKKG